jgi:3-oxoacyl-[acyl-carrier protein] reductase
LTGHPDHNHGPMPSLPRSPRLPTHRNQAHQPVSAVLVTGASGGIGRAISLAFAAKGWYVGVHYHQNKAAAEATRRAVVEAGGTGDLYQADIRHTHEVQQMIEAYRRTIPTPQAFVCNAGVGASRLIIRQPEEEWAQVMATNLTGTFHCLCAMAESLIAQRDGSIIVVGSYAGLHAHAGQAAYAASKAGLIGLIKTAAQEWGPYNVRVNLVLPGWQDTGLAGDAMPGTDRFTDHAIGRPPALAEVAKTVVHLAELRDVSGQIWNCDSRNL